MRKAIIIGATSGLGLETARLLHKDGWTVGLMGRREERLASISEEFLERVFWHRIDVCEESAAEELTVLIRKMCGVELILIASGIGKQNPTLEYGVELATLQTNGLGFTRVMTTAYRYFAGKGSGHIAIISSIAGVKGLGAAPAYSATKRFQNTYMQCLAQQAKMSGLDITFTDIRPGFVDTDFLKGGSYPMLMKPDMVARHIVKAIYKHKRKVIIDWRYAILVFFWRMIPDWIWERLRVV